MANPLEKIIALAKRGDRRVLLGGAAVIGGGVGLIIFLHNRNGGAGVAALPDQQTIGTPEGGGGSGSGSSPLDLGTDTAPAGDLGTATGLSLPALPDLTSMLPDLSQAPLPPSSDFGSFGDSLLPTASPIYGGGLPSLPGFEQPPSYGGADYGGITAGALPTVGGINGGTSMFVKPIDTPKIAPKTAEPTANPLQSAGALNLNALVDQYRYLGYRADQATLATLGNQLKQYQQQQVLPVLPSGLTAQNLKSYSGAPSYRNDQVTLSTLGSNLAPYIPTRTLPAGLTSSNLQTYSGPPSYRNDQQSLATLGNQLASFAQQQRMLSGAPSYRNDQPTLSALGSALARSGVTATGVKK